MISFQAFLTFILGCYALSISAQEPVQTTSSCDDESRLLTMPAKMINRLTDITVDSKGLLPLWKSAYYLTNDRILTSEYRQLTCQELSFNEVFTEESRCDDSSTHAELASYYNELVIQLKVSEAILSGNYIEKEVNEKHKDKVEEKLQHIIEMLDGEILPILSLMLNATTNNANCSDTQEKVNNTISSYNNCAAVQLANTYLAQTTLNLYRVLISIDGVGAKDEVDRADYYNGDGEWCIIQ